MSNFVIRCKNKECGKVLGNNNKSGYCLRCGDKIRRQKR